MEAVQDPTITSSSDSSEVAPATWAEYHTMVLMRYERDGPDSSDWWIDDISRPSSPSGWSAATVEISSTEDEDSEDEEADMEISSTDDESDDEEDVQIIN